MMVLSPPTSASFIDEKIVASGPEGPALWSQPGRCWKGGQLLILWCVHFQGHAPQRPTD